MTHPSPSSSQPLRVGVVGLGYAGTTHLTSFLGIPGVEVVALAGKETDRLASLGAAHQIPHLVEDWQDLVALPDVDVVSVATPNVLHAPVSLAALRAGKHVFCEKPLALTAAEAREMVDASRSANRVLEVAFNYRRRADVRFARSYIETEGIGRIYHARASWKRRAGIPGLRSWFTSPTLAGGGALIDLGPHVLDSLLYLMGEPRVVAVSAVTHGELGRAGYGAMNRQEQMASDTGLFEVEDLASALLRLEDGSSVAFEISWAGHTVDDEDISIELLGVDAGIRLFVPRYKTDDTLRIYRDQAGVNLTIAPEVHVAGSEHPTVIAEFVDIVRSGDWSGHHGEFALHRTEVLDACYRSAAEGREVVL
ncbi:Gfo/Idh/MocA family protein [Homoserinibacter sp. GY 40078]|uniref:Gfo/Idh/MocA family protein n=1 Tax=Homoserinibacter sp. GY 40078 TaxID=2603275 RepID=UPI0011C8A65A|nr:Gfo/Idh/MocA family oxidoreductase [Homoserinibacter sp. GY 40078]TXK18771.1 Gfo/Idh/MocA family oxidoreductase [Homoserinibacter sp. GY 40078]